MRSVTLEIDKITLSKDRTIYALDRRAQRRFSGSGGGRGKKQKGLIFPKLVFYSNLFPAVFLQAPYPALGLLLTLVYTPYYRAFVCFKSLLYCIFFRTEAYPKSK